MVSRFPLLTETFILRELDRVSRLPGLDVELYALFRSDDSVVHQAAIQWIARRRLPSRGSAVRSVIWWTLREPRKLAAALSRTARDHCGSPQRLVKALVTLLAALDHARDMRARGVEHVHAHFATYPALTAWVAHQMIGVSYSITPHAHDIFIDQSGLRTKLRSARAVVAISDYHWMFLQHFGANPSRLYRIGCGLDLSTYGFAPRRIPATDPLDVLVVSSFKPYKGHHVLLEALTVPTALERDLRIEFVGTGPLEEQLRQLANARGLAQKCRFSGARDQDYVRRRLGEAHILVQPSLVQEDGDTEGLPTTLLEAAATGITMVATRVAGVPELVEDGVSGFLSEPDSATSLRSALIRALSAGDHLDAIQTEARRRVEARHDLDQVAPALARAFAGRH